MPIEPRAYLRGIALFTYAHRRLLVVLDSVCRAALIALNTLPRDNGVARLIIHSLGRTSEHRAGRIDITRTGWAYRLVPQVPHLSAMGHSSRPSTWAGWRELPGVAGGSSLDRLRTPRRWIGGRSLDDLQDATPAPEFNTRLPGLPESGQAVGASQTARGFTTGTTTPPWAFLHLGACRQHSSPATGSTLGGLTASIQP